MKISISVYTDRFRWSHAVFDWNVQTGILKYILLPTNIKFSYCQCVEVSSKEEKLYLNYESADGAADQHMVEPACLLAAVSKVHI